MQLQGGIIVGVGIDLIEVDRLDRALARHGTRLEKRIFTRRELEDCRARADRVQALAARFAAKEACLKALGTGWSAGLSFRQVELTRPTGAAPRVQLHGAAAERAARLGVTVVHVSLTHQPRTAAAVVVLEGGG